MRARAVAKNLVADGRIPRPDPRNDPHRSDAAPADPHQPAGKRRQVHGARQRAACRAHDGPARKHQSPHRLRGDRHGRGDDAAAAARDLQALLAGRQLDDEAVRRHGARPDHQQTPGANARRRHHQRKRSGQRQLIPRRRRNRPAGRASECWMRPTKPSRARSKNTSRRSRRAALRQPRTVRGNRPTSVFPGGSCWPKTGSTISG